MCDLQKIAHADWAVLLSAVLLGLTSSSRKALQLALLVVAAMLVVTLNTQCWVTEPVVTWYYRVTMADVVRDFKSGGDHQAERLEALKRHIAATTARDVLAVRAACAAIIILWAAVRVRKCCTRYTTDSGPARAHTPVQQPMYPPPPMPPPSMPTHHAQHVNYGQVFSHCKIRSVGRDCGGMPGYDAWERGWDSARSSARR